MKKSIFLILVFSSLLSFSKVWRVNNNPIFVGGATNPCSHCFTDLQNAINSSSVAPGDTLHIEASAINYGYNIELTKKLVLLGSGYLLTDNLKSQANKNTSSLGQFRIKDGASGSVISGLSFNYSNSYEDIIFDIKSNLKDITIRNCYIGGDIYLGYFSNSLNVTNVEISNNIIAESVTKSNSYNATFYNLNVRNNVIYGNLNIGPTSSGAIKQNIVVGHVTIYSGIAFYNNFVIGSNATLTQNNNSSTNIYHNIFVNSKPTWFSGGNNEFGKSLTTLLPWTATTGEEDKFVPYSSCTACFKGYKPPNNTEEIGVFGGADPYQRAGLPAIPSIYDLKMISTTYQSDSTVVEISTISND